MAQPTVALPPDEDDKENDSETEDPVDDIMSANDPVMKPVQEVIRRKLLERLALVESELLVKENRLKGKLKEREDYGADMYLEQQHLARIQAAIEQLTDQITQAKSQRQVTEASVATIKSESEKLSKITADAKKKANTVKVTGETLKQTVASLEKHKKELEQKLLMQKKAVGKATQEQEKVLSEKQEQDLLVDRLSERARELSAQVEQLKAQRTLQQAQSKELKDALLEAQAELDALIVDKKELVHQWTTSTSALTQRDESLVSIEAAVRAQQQEVFSGERANETLKQQVRAHQDRSEVLQRQTTKLSNDLAAVTRALKATEEKYEELKVSYAMTTRLQQEAEQNLAKSTQESVQETNKNNTLRDQIARAAREKVAVEAQVAEAVQARLVVDQKGQNMAKRIADIRKQIMQQEILISEVENSLARDLLATAQVTSRTEMLRDELKGLNEIHENLAADITRMEKTSVANTVEMKKKQLRTEQLNRQIVKQQERLTNMGAGNSNMTPADLEISKLEDELTRTQTDTSHLKSKWVTRCAELLNHQKELEKLREELRTLESKTSVLAGKERRGRANIQAEQTEMSAVQHSYKSLQDDLQRISKLVVERTGRKEDLAQKTLFQEADFVAALQEQERASIELQETVFSLQASHGELESALVEAEHQILLWQRKIELTKELKKQLRPSDGHNESQELNQEIHRMRVFLGQLLRDKENLTQELVRAVERSMTKAAKKPSQNVAVVAQHQAQGLEESLRRVGTETGDVEYQIQMAREELAALQAAVAAARIEEQRAQEYIIVLQDKLSALRQQHSQSFAELLAAQRKSRFFEGVLEGKTVPKNRQFDTLMETETASLRGLTSVVDFLAQEHGDTHPDLPTLSSKVQALSSSV